MRITSRRRRSRQERAPGTSCAAIDTDQHYDRVELARAVELPEVPAWLRAHYAQVDADRIEDYLEDFDEGVELRFGAAAPVRGKAAVREALAAGHRAHGMRHEFRNVWEAGTTTIVEFSVTYTYPGGESATVPAVTILERTGSGLIAGLRICVAASGEGEGERADPGGTA
jgi:SnoaL-like domain